MVCGDNGLVEIDSQGNPLSRMVILVEQGDCCHSSFVFLLTDSRVPCLWQYGFSKRVMPLVITASLCFKESRDNASYPEENQKVASCWRWNEEANTSSKCPVLEKKRRTKKRSRKKKKYPRKETETSFTALYYSDVWGNAVACDAYNHAMFML